MNEVALHRWIARNAPLGPDVRVGPGDDAAVVRLGREQLVLTADAVAEGVHFAPGTPWRIVGRKLVARVLSDVAAMGAEPRSILLSAGLPRGFRDAAARDILRGAFAMARRHGASVVGGDLSSMRGRPFVAATLVGRVPPGGRVLLRSRARPGDRLLVTGALGGSILGKHLRFVPRLREGRRLADVAGVHAALDVSDGLALDLARLCEASGVGASLDATAIPIAAAAHKLARMTGRPPLEHAIGDGEDHELLIAAGRTAASRLAAGTVSGIGRMTSIGVVLETPGLWIQEGPDAKRRRLRSRGWVHR